MRCTSEAMLYITESCVTWSHCICNNIVCLFRPSRGFLASGVQGLLTEAATEDSQSSICSILAACTQISTVLICAAQVNANASSLHESCYLTFAARVILDELAAVCRISRKGHPALTGASCKTQTYSTAVLRMEAPRSISKKVVHSET